MPFTSRHLLGLEGISRDELFYIIDSATSFKEISERDIKKVPTLRGKTVVSLFYEASTRTRMSFEIAAKRMSADFVSLSASVSSTSKGETLLDTARNIAAMRPDCLIVRHHASGAARFLADRIDCPIINAGDGAHEHPTQALLDLLTIRERLGRLTDLKVAIIGDVLHSRVARSNIHALRTLGTEVRLVGPPTFLPAEAKAWGHVCHDLHEGVRDVDVIIMLRIQRERQGLNFFPSLEEYARLFCLSRAALEKAASDVVVLHPGPMNRGIEIASDVADGPYSVVMDQVTNGVATRMAVLFLLVNRAPVAATVPEAASAETPRLRRSVG
jgi:aspartate carbamoyltransferase catalytic subunit